MAFYLDVAPGAATVVLALGLFLVFVLLDGARRAVAR